MTHQLFTPLTRALVLGLLAILLSFCPSDSRAAIVLANPYSGQDVYNTFWGAPGDRWTLNVLVSSGSYSVDRIDFFFGQSGGGVAVPTTYVDLLSGVTVLATSDTVPVTTAENSAYYLTNLATIQSVYRMTFTFPSPVVLSPGTYGFRLSTTNNNQFNFWTGNAVSDASFFVDSGAQLFELYGSGGAPVPEPGTWAAAALLVGTAGFVRWRKRAKVS